MKKIILLIPIVFLSYFFLLNLNYSLAQTTPPAGQSNDIPNAAAPKLANPLKANTPQELIGQVIDAILGIVGSLALLMFVFGGLTWMTSSGNAEKVAKGKNIIVWAAIGLVIVFFAYGITRVLIIGIRGT